MTYGCRRSIPAGCLVLLAALLAAGSGIAAAGEASTGGETPVASAKVSIQGFAFHPDSIGIKAGERVDWNNDDGPAHNVTFKDGSPGAVFLSPGQRFSRVFDRPGTYEYFCSLHSYMTGRVTVTVK